MKPKGAQSLDEGRCYDVAEVESKLNALRERRERINAQMSALSAELFNVENEIEFLEQDMAYLIEAVDRFEAQMREQYRQSLEEDDFDIPEVLE